MTGGQRAAAWTVIALALVYRVKLWLTTSPVGGYDFYSHYDYLVMVARGEFPGPGRLWQSYHPPGYYFLTARLADLSGLSLLKAGQTLSLLASALIAVPAYWIARRVAAGWEPLAAAVILTIPVSMETSRMLYGQQLATLWIGLFLMCLMANWSQPPRLGGDLGTALLWSAAILTRTDGLMLGLPLAALLWKRLRKADEWRERGEAVASFLFNCAVAFSAASFLFLRNLAQYDTLLLTNRHPRIFPYFLSETLNLPGFLSWTCLVNPGWGLWSDPSVPRVDSLPAYFYQQFWSAGMPYPLPVQVKLLSGLLLWVLVLFALPSLREEQWRPVVAAALANFLLVGLFLCAQPDFTNYKAAYLHGAFYLFALSVARGAAEVQKRRGEAAASVLAFLPQVMVLVGCFW